MKKDFIITFLTEFLVLASAILVYKLAAVFLGKVGFSEYALSRRTVALIQPAILLGLRVSIPRYIALTDSGSNQRDSGTYFTSGFLTITAATLLASTALGLFRPQFSYLFFGSTRYGHIFIPISLMLLGLNLHVACYSYFRGKMTMLKANSLQFINQCVVPLLAFLVGKTIVKVLMFTALGWIAVSLFFLLLILKNLKWKRIGIISHAKELLACGWQRTPGDFAHAALLALPAIFVAHLTGVKEAGYVAFGISLLNMVGSVFTPVGLILLPKVSQLIASKNLDLVKHYILVILKITFALTLLGVAFFEIFAKEIIGIYLGKSFPDLVLIARLILIGGLPFALHVSMVSVIDAYYFRAINTINLIISLAMFLLLSGIVILMSKEYLYIIYGFEVALFVLGGLTLYEIIKILRRKDYAQ